jgi:hypothetical protein
MKVGLRRDLHKDEKRKNAMILNFFVVFLLKKDEKSDISYH